jgi:hypothetical protein
MAEDVDDVWELRKDNILLGILSLTEQDMFWFICDFAATEAFEPYRDLFAREAQLLDHGGDEFENLYAQIGELNLTLNFNDTYDDENVFLLHILDKTASFRALNSPWIGGWVDKSFT